MKKLLAVFLTMFVFCTHAEEWSAGFNAPTNNGARMMYFKIVLDLPALQDGEFSGQVLKVYGATKCIYPVELRGVVQGEVIGFRSEFNEMKGCGRIVFNGRKVGDTLEGVIPFQGIQAEVVFKK